MIWQSLLYLKRAGQIFWYYLNLRDWFLAYVLCSSVPIYDSLVSTLFNLFLSLLLLSVINFYTFWIVQRKEISGASGSGTFIRW